MIWPQYRFLFPAILLIAGCFALPFPASAQVSTRQPVLVELFTSEGCSSCPPADQFLMALDRAENIPGARVIVLSEHVDYWDHDGWHDPWSSEEMTERQTAYTSQFRQDSNYTPEAVIDGAQGITANNRPAVVAAIEEAAKHPSIAITIADVNWSDGKATATITTTETAKADLYATLADDHDQSNVLRGENSGHQLEHVAVVRVMKKVGSLDHPFNRPIAIPFSGNKQQKPMRLVVFAQDRRTGRILGVAEVPAQPSSPPAPAVAQAQMPAK
ncbi:DUF1223 domain-containing protein [Paracidobacterium acidisoli]|uniref:DUF1223 domain-containing protein n=1 Tax=Paracidobacterium acidisoli TaxID=2303751 RepID=A0A372IRS2_9BACT|nr:DUF1223 domain-containing protein [Paracidobacterium acidisoli]MBT9330494.1 DUF1223 domain-containing protein [Paracidobacterium acidisoli]